MAKASTNNSNTVFIDTNLNTHLALVVDHTQTVSDLKNKILYEHPLCFPNIGDVKINAVKVKRRGHFYHLSDSMFVKSAFEGVNKCWFLSVDVSTSGEQIEGQLPPYLDSGNQGIIAHPLENRNDVLSGGLPKRDVLKSIELEGQLAHDDYCQQSIIGTNKKLDPGVEEKNASGRAEKITGTEDNYKILTSNSNKKSDPMEDDANEGDEISKKDTTFEVSDLKKDVFDTVVETQSKRSPEAPQSIHTAKKRKINKISGLKVSPKDSKASLIQSKKEASELDATVMQRSSENDQKSKDVEGKKKRKKKSSKQQDYLVSAVRSSGTAGSGHENVKRETNSALLTEEDVQAAVQYVVESHGFTVNSKQPNPVKEIDIKSSSSGDVKRKSAHAVEEIQSLNDDRVVYEKGQHSVDIVDGNNQNLQIRASRSDNVVTDGNCDSVPHQMVDVGKEGTVLEKTEVGSTEAEMLRPSTHEEGKNSVAIAMVLDETDMAGQKESKKKRKKSRGTKKSTQEAKVAAVSEFDNFSAAGAQSLNNDVYINDKEQPSVDSDGANDDNQRDEASGGKNVVDNNNNSVSHNIDIENGKGLEEDDIRLTTAEVLGLPTHEEGKTYSEMPSETARPKKSTKKRKKLRGIRKSNDEVTNAAAPEFVDSSAVGVQSLNNDRAINDRGQPSVEIDDANNNSQQAGASKSENVIHYDINSIVSNEINIEKDTELLEEDHRSTAAEVLEPSPLENGKSTDGHKKSTKKRKKLRGTRKLNEATIAAELKGLNSSVGVQHLDNGATISKGQPSVDTEDANKRNIQIGTSSSENVIITADDHNSLSQQMDNVGKEKEALIEIDHRSIDGEMLRPSSREEGETYLEKSVPSKVSDATETLGQKESTKKRKKRKEIKESNEEVTAASVTECISKEEAAADIGNHDVTITEKIRKSEENAVNTVCKVKKSRKQQGSSKYSPDVQIKCKPISSKDSDPAIKHDNVEASFELTKKISVAETNFVSKSSGSNQERGKATALDDGHYITQKNSGNVEYLAHLDTGNDEKSLRQITNKLSGTETEKENSCDSGRINFREFFVPKQNPNEAVAAGDEIPASKSTKKNKSKREKHSEGVSDFPSLPRLNENQVGEGKPEVGQSNSIQDDGSSSKDKHNEFMCPTGKKFSEDPVKGEKFQKSSISNKHPSISRKTKRFTADESAIDLSNDGGFASPCSNLEIFKQVTSKKHNDAARTSSGQNNGEFVDGSDNEKSLLAKSGASIWDESSEDEDTSIDSDNSTRTPSDNSSLSSANSDEESTATLNSPQTGHQYSKRKDSGDRSANLCSTAQKGMSMYNILRSSSRYKRAKLTASQSEIEDTESQPVSNSQPNLPKLTASQSGIEDTETQPVPNSQPSQ